MFKNSIVFIRSIFIIQVLTSCTVLQWRSTDIEIKERFLNAGIPTEISYFNVDSLDLKIRVQKVPSDTATANIVFLHGSPSSLSAWTSYLENDPLLQKANLYAIDRPGYGYSNFGDEMTSITKQATLMSALINSYKLNNVIVVGSSYGGPLVARMAAINTSIKAVVMISPAIDPKQEKKIWQSNFTQWWLTRWLVPTGYRVAGDEKTIHAEELEKLEKDWDKVTVPVIHIHGDIDDIVPYGNVNYTKEIFSDITIVTKTDRGHEIAWKNPELIMPHLFSLLTKIQKKEL